MAKAKGSTGAIRKGFGQHLYAAILAMPGTAYCGGCNCYTWREHRCDAHWYAREFTTGEVTLAQPGHVELAGEVWAEDTAPSIPEPICEAVA